MEKAKPKFFIRLKDAVFNFDEYRTFSEEKVSVAIKYFLKLVLLFSVIITIALTYRAVITVNNVINTFTKNSPEFSFVDNTLVLNGEDKQYVFENDYIDLGIIINSEVTEFNQIETNSNHKNLIVLLKDKLILKNENGVDEAFSYDQVNSEINLSKISKQSILDFANSNVKNVFIVLFSIIILLLVFAVFLVRLLLDVLLISVLGMLISRIVGLMLKYNSIFSISIYSLTLPVFLFMIYIVVNAITGFNIIYFDVAYRMISYIYLVTAIMIIKSDLIKQKIELNKIVQTQKEIREEKEEENEDEEDKEEDKEESQADKNEQEEKKKKVKTKKEDLKENQEPEGNQA